MAREGGKGRQDKGEEGKEVSGQGGKTIDVRDKMKAGNEIVRRRQDDGQDERGKGFRWQDDGDRGRMGRVGRCC